ncbi:cysteine desulfuration protein SufE [Photobacterium kasasachensis]|uniref:cysteine desulfuration protein SufE n=1 Tax=Photobacterium kasasachensis TaxID=2910240 RepID=UPI003D11EF00
MSSTLAKINLIAFDMKSEKLKRNLLSCDDWEERYLYIIQLGNQQPIMAEADKTSDTVIHGCQSQVWVKVDINSSGEFSFIGDSDASLVKGLMAMVFMVYEGKTAEAILEFDIHGFFDELQLHHYLTPTRSQGLVAMVEAVRAKALNTLVVEC